MTADSDHSSESDFERACAAFTFGYCIGGPLDPEEENYIRQGMLAALRSLREPSIDQRVAAGRINHATDSEIWQAMLDELIRQGEASK